MASRVAKRASAVHALVALPRRIPRDMANSTQIDGFVIPLTVLAGKLAQYPATGCRRKFI
jgi:hypothetical protein